MERKAQVTLFIILAVFFVGALVLLSWIKNEQEPGNEMIECNTDQDCVPDECCDAINCVSLDKKPQCDNINCTPGCFSYLTNNLTCEWKNPGSCQCIKNKCLPKFSN